MLQIVKSLVVLLSAFLTVATYAVPLEVLSVTTDDDVLIKGLRLRNDGGQPVILVHGFMENTRAWREVAYELHSQGHDVFMYNLRGHGNGEQISKILSGNHERYNFDRMVAYDIPAMIDHTYTQTNRPAIYVGHSMGTMSGRLSLSGIRHGPEGMYFSQEAVEWSLQRVKGAVAIASPTTFKTNYFIYKLLRLAPDEFINIKRLVLSAIVSNNAPYLPDDNRTLNRFLRRVSSRVIEGVSKTKIARALLEGVIHVENLSTQEQEVARLFYKGLSNPPVALVKNARIWASEGYQSIDGRVRYDGFPIPERLPYVYVGTGMDRLANPSDLLSDMLTLNQRNLLFAYYPEFSHVDIISGQRGGKESARLIGSLIESQFDFETLRPSDSRERLFLIHPDLVSLPRVNSSSCAQLLRTFL